MSAAPRWLALAPLCRTRREIGPQPVLQHSGFSFLDDLCFGAHSQRPNYLEAGESEQGRIGLSKGFGSLARAHHVVAFIRRSLPTFSRVYPLFGLRRIESWSPRFINLNMTSLAKPASERTVLDKKKANSGPNTALRTSQNEKWLLRVFHAFDHFGQGFC